MRFARQPTEEEREELERMTQQEVGRVALRAQMILLSAREFTAPEIADIQNTSDVSVYKWLDRFDEEGPEGLYDRPRSGRPPKVDEETEQVIEETMSEPPTEEGYNFTCWTVPLLTEHLQQTLGKTFCPETIRRALHALGFRWRRPRWAVMREDPQEAELMWAIWEAVASATPDHNEDICLYGVLELNSGETFHAYHDKGRSDYTIAYLKQLLDRYPQRPILLIWDQATYHTSGAVEEWLAEHPRITTMELPKYAPELNPVEHIWRQLKDRAAANLTRSLQSIQDACDRFFQQHCSDEILKMAGLAVHS